MCGKCWELGLGTRRRAYICMGGSKGTRCVNSPCPVRNLTSFSGSCATYWPVHYCNVTCKLWALVPKGITSAGVSPSGASGALSLSEPIVESDWEHFRRSFSSIFWFLTPLRILHVLCSGWSQRSKKYPAISTTCWRTPRSNRRLVKEIQAKPACYCSTYINIETYKSEFNAWHS